MAEYLLEIGLEEMPAAYMNGAVRDLKKNAEGLFATERLQYETLETYATPRRLVLCVRGLVEMQQDLSEEVKGPSVKAAYKDGEATKPLEGFLRAHGFTEADVYTKDVKGNDYVFCKREEKGRPAKDVLSEVLPGLILGMKFPKSMRWGSFDLRYLRPIRWVVSLCNDEVVPVDLGVLSADRISRGHRTLGHEAVEISSATAYFDMMEKEYVIVDQMRRREMILSQIATIFAGTDEHYQEDAALLDEVINLVEYPTALRGSFDEKFLELPDELVITPMKEHQRYFPVLKNDGTLTNGFITVRNGTEKYLDIVRQGNENVLRARLSDAEFFYQEDLKRGLEAGEEKLKAIVFQEKLGTIYEKTQRLEYIAGKIADDLKCDAQLRADTVTAARCTKLDLVSNVVSEFPELQGLVGEYYYLAEHPDKKNIAQAIREHYMPRFANDALPQTLEGSIVSVADKIDTIVGCFYAGIIPTGSQDPYALRRQALGICNIIIDQKWSLSLDRLITIARDAYAMTGLMFNDTETDRMIHQFFEQRLLKIFKDNNTPNDVVQAVMKVGYDDLFDAVLRADALQAFIKDGDKGTVKRTLDNDGRAANITEHTKEMTINAQGFVVDEEKALYDAVIACEDSLPALVESKSYGEVIAHFAALNDCVETFFDNILVMDEDQAVRANRLALVKRYANVLGAYYKLDEISNA